MEAGERIIVRAGVGRKAGRGRLGWFYGRFARSRIVYNKYVSRDMTNDKNV